MASTRKGPALPPAPRTKLAGARPPGSAAVASIFSRGSIEGKAARLPAPDHSAILDDVDQDREDYADADPALGRRSPRMTRIILVVVPAAITLFACLSLAVLATMFGWLPR
jgi:hypothetical protein